MQTMWRYAKSAADKSPDEGTTITITKHEEKEGIQSNIEYFIVDISNLDKAREDNEYNACLKMFDSYSVFKKLFGSKEVPKNEFLARKFKSKFFNIDAVKKQLDKAREKGEEALGNKSVANALLQLGVMTHLGRYASLDDAENAFGVQEQEMLEELKNEGYNVKS